MFIPDVCSAALVFITGSHMCCVAIRVCSAHLIQSKAVYIPLEVLLVANPEGFSLEKEESQGRNS